MMILLIVGAAIAAICWYLLYRSQARLSQQLSALDAQLAKPLFRCVVIEAGTDACQQILSHSRQPILVDQAPILPLAGCDLAKCGCHFKRLDDRRSGVDRRELQMADKKVAFTTANKRFVKERRLSPIQSVRSPESMQLTRSMSR